jgi:hypothetical protein
VPQFEDIFCRITHRRSRESIMPRSRSHSLKQAGSAFAVEGHCLKPDRFRLPVLAATDVVACRVPEISMRAAHLRPRMDWV